MLLKFICLFVMCFSTKCVLSGNPQFQPVMYSTYEVQKPDAREERIFRARMCSPTHYDNLIASAEVNIGGGWDTSVSVCAYIKVCTDYYCNRIIGQNDDASSHKLSRNVVFKYMKEYGDIFVSVTTCDDDDINYALSVRFSKGIINAIEDTHHKPTQLGPIKKQCQWGIDLEQIGYNGEIGEVGYRERVEYFYYFCATPSKGLDFGITTTATAMDEKSATNLYVCLNQEGSCRTEQATGSDPSASALTTVYVNNFLHFTAKVNVVVVGFSDKDVKSKFTISSKLVDGWCKNCNSSCEKK